jgi:hypothetical protein
MMSIVILLRDSIDTVLSSYCLRRNFLLRLFCRKVGIQILQKDYGLGNKRTQAFVDDDIVNLFPVVKCVSPLVSLGLLILLDLIIGR